MTADATLLDNTFHALSHQVRRAMLRLLAIEPYRVTDLAAKFKEISLNAVSKHIKTLERASLIERRKDGRIHNLQLDAAPLRVASEEIAHYRQFWEGNLDSLATFLESTNQPKPNNKKP